MPLSTASRPLRCCAILTAFAALALVPPNTLAAPNVVVINPNLVTSGQPSTLELSDLKAEHFEAVIYLAPFTVSDSVKEEPDIVTGQGIEFIHIPIPFDAPKESHFESLSDVLHRLQGKKVLVHCQVNLRASTMVFLFRVLALKEDPDSAYNSVLRVWSPRGPWKAMAEGLLAKHGVAFHLY